MGFWSGIKYALNSTLGTSDFESLDKIIKGQKSLVASDNLYCVVSTEYIYTAKGVNKEKTLFKLKADGSFKFSFSAYIDTSYDASIYLVKNGIQTTSSPLVKVDDTSGYATYFSGIVSANKNDIIGIMLQPRSGNRLFINEISIYADIIDNSALEIL